jgi:hypothetical protein
MRKYGCEEITREDCIEFNWAGLDIGPKNWGAE